jgi:hypothetical protein
MQREPFRARELLRVLIEHEVDFVVVGGIGGSARGSAYITQDLDIANAREPENLERRTSPSKEATRRPRD